LRRGGQCQRIGVELVDADNGSDISCFGRRIAGAVEHMVAVGEAANSISSGRQAPESWNIG
jgi:hypothetical protein